MAYVTSDQIAAVRSLDLLTYLQQYIPDELIKVGNTYATRSHDSLKISNGKWYWWSQKTGGVSALDYLIKVRGVPLPTAVEHLSDCMGIPLPAHARQSSDTPREVARNTTSPLRASPRRTQEKPPNKQSDSRRELILPEAFQNSRRVFAYLSNRGIDKEIINFCLQNKTLYEDAEYHNAVFIGYGGKTPRYGFVRSTLSKSTFMRELTGSDKRFGFQMPAREENANMVYVFESAIDALSFASILKHDGVDWRMAHYLSLGGTAMQKEGIPPALAHFLKGNPQITKLALCLDNDRTGQQAAHSIISALPDMRAAYVPPRTGKDFNEMLCAMKGITSRAKMRGHKEEVR